MTIKTIGIIGHGAFGTLLETLIRRFAPERELRIHSNDVAPDGKRFFSLEEACRSDAVILAVPISAFEEVLTTIIPLVQDATVIVDISTVKIHTSALLRAKAEGRPFVSTHPMWGPESYEKMQGDVSDFRIVIADSSLSDSQLASFTAFLTRCGFPVIRMGSDEHDRLLAESLFVTHFVGQTLQKAGIQRTAIDTPSFGFLMDAVESVRGDEALFKDVFRFNPFCRPVLDRLGDAAADVRKLLGEEA